MIIYSANYGNVDFEIPTNHFNLTQEEPPVEEIDEVMANHNKLAQRGSPIDLSGIEFVYFTDIAREIPGWNVVVEKRPEETSLLQAKWVKTHSHELFPNDVSMFMDANRALLRRPDHEFKITTKSAPVTVFQHYWDLPREYSKCMRHIGSKKKVLAQRNAYRDDGFDWFESHAYIGNTIIRHPSAVAFNELWWRDILKYSHRDQLSLPYAAWKEGPANYTPRTERPTYKACHHRNNGRFYQGRGLQGWSPPHTAQ